MNLKGTPQVDWPSSFDDLHRHSESWLAEPTTANSAVLGEQFDRVFPTFRATISLSTEEVCLLSTLLSRRLRRQQIDLSFLANAIGESSLQHLLRPDGELLMLSLVKSTMGTSTDPLLSVSERIVFAAHGVTTLDATLTAYLASGGHAGPVAPELRSRVERWLQGTPHSSRAPLLLHPSQATVLDELHNEVYRLVRFDAATLPDSPHLLARLRHLVRREHALAPILVVLENAQDRDQVRKLLAGLPVPVIVVTTVAEEFRDAVSPGEPDSTFAAQRSTWARELEVSGSLAGQFAACFPTPPHEITDIARRCRVEAALREQTPADLAWRELRGAAGRALAHIASVTRPTRTVEDIVLPSETRDGILRVIESARARVHALDRAADAHQRLLGVSVTALFSGPSGTGKSLAAETIAHALRLDLVKVDLARVVSKYIGETEKNLHEVFEACEGGSAVLLFDEADALFGKRTEVNDSRDRHANMEVSYLLQRMERFSGIAILTSNMRDAFDPAFLRRLRHVVRFAFPAQGERLRLWQANAARVNGVEPEHVRGLERLPLTGASIERIVVSAAFRESDPRGMRARVLAETRFELEKVDRPVPSWLHGMMQSRGTS